MEVGWFRALIPLGSMSRKSILFLLVAFGALGFGARWSWQALHPATGLFLSGNVDIREVNLGFRVSGKVQEVLKQEGDGVQAGEVMARLDNQPYQKEVDEAEAQKSSLRSRLEMLRHGYRREEIDQARAVLKEREASLANAERLRTRKHDLADRRVVPEQEFDDAEAARDEAEARRNSAQAALRLMEAGYRSEEIHQAEADLARAEAQLASARLRMEDTTLKAPEEATVMSRVVEPGAIVAAGSTVLNLSLRSPVWVRLYVHEPDLGRIHPGQKVEVFTDSRPEKPYEGQIGFISPRAEFTPKNVETRELRTQLVYRLRVTVLHPDDGLRQGMPVTAHILEK